MNRVMVVGNGGAGKSTFARRLGGTLALPVIHLDSHFWRPGWRIPEPMAWRQQLAALAARFGAHLRVIRLSGDRDAEDFLASIDTR